MERTTMNSASQKANYWLRLTTIVVTAAVLGSVPLRLRATDNQPHLSHRKLKKLIENAETPGDHERLVSYYCDQASRLLQKSKEEEERAAYYDAHPLEWNAWKNHMLGKASTYYRRLAKRYAKQAMEADALALIQEQMAKAADNRWRLSTESPLAFCRLYPVGGRGKGGSKSFAKKATEIGITEEDCDCRAQSSKARGLPTLQLCIGVRRQGRAITNPKNELLGFLKTQ